MPTPLRICQVFSEFAPLAKTGGLADVTGALSRYLHARGHDVRLFLPFYSIIDTRRLEIAPVASVQDVPLALGAHHYRFSILTARTSGSTLPVYLVHCPALYAGPEIYTSGPEKHLPFLLLTRAAIEACQRLGFGPQIFHCHDWHAAFGPVYLRHLYSWDRLFAATKTILTIHNIGYQGIIPAAAVGDLGLDALRHLLHQDDLKHDHINSLKHGILYADTITTVSPTYAREIRTEQYGMGLETALRMRGDAVIGILNGIDYEEWNPASDRYLPYHYDAQNLAGKERVKRSLLERLKLKSAPRAPLLGIVSRMTGQKGFDLLFESLPELLARRDFRLAVLGNGETRYAEYFTALQRRFPDQVAFHRGFDEELAHLIEAGSDIFLMPSLYEPCGLNQMYSLRYGTAPIVRNTGGLADSVQNYDPATGVGTGIVFNDFNPEALAKAIITALALYQDRTQWARIMRNGMAQDFSWDKQGALYVDLYNRLLTPI
jgi:starch synthase